MIQRRPGLKLGGFGAGDDPRGVGGGFDALSPGRVAFDPAAGSVLMRRC
jgi:hypothetical protein